jgi:hypothetical protein
MKFIALAFMLTIFANAAWAAESCPTPAVKHGKPLHGRAKRVFIMECCERMAETKGGSLEEKRHFANVCQARSKH